MENNIANRLEELRGKVRMHDEFYDKGNPIISDTEYDTLYLELEKLELEHPGYFDKDSPTQKIVTTVVSELKSVTHRVPMLSHQKTTTKEEVYDFFDKFDGHRGYDDRILVQEKLDGITIVVAYENGHMVEAVSRGNGEVGEDLFHNVRTFENLPKIISFRGRLEVRAEAVLPFEAFDKMNVDGKYSNPRNLVSGSLRQLDSKRVAGKGFKAIVYDLIHMDDIEDYGITTDQAQLVLLKGLGFEVVKSKGFIDKESAFAYIEDYGCNTRGKLPHLIDGMVLKVNDLNLRKEMGDTSKFPKWATAYKFKSLDATTKLLGITDQVGKTGQITPVAELESVNIDGVNIARATLHNYELLVKGDFRIGDTVLVKRANDVIPQVVRPIVEMRDGSEVIKTPPTHCPVCGSITEQDGANLYCTGLSCQPQIEGKIQHFASRDAMYIDSLGDKTVQLLLENGLIETIADLYRLEEKKARIVTMEGFGDKKYEKMMEGIEESKKRELPNLIYGLSIRNIGQGSGKRLSRVFHSLGEYIDGAKDLDSFMAKLLTVEDFGEIKANSIIDFFTNEKNVEVIRELISLGVNPVVEKKTGGSILAGKTFVVTGKVLEFKNRNELQAKIEELGGKVSGSVSKDTTFLINNDNDSPSSKNVKAKSLGVRIITEKDFLMMI